MIFLERVRKASSILQRLSSQKLFIDAWRKLQASLV